MELRKLRLRTGLETPSEVSDRSLLILKRRSVLVVKPTKLLENFSVVWVIGHDSFVCPLGVYKLPKSELSSNWIEVTSKRTSFCCSCTCPIWNQISAWARGFGGL